MRVLVTGGTGVLGKQVTAALVARDHVPVLLARHDPAAVLPDSAEFVKGDVLTGDGLNGAFADVDAVIHAATAPRRMKATEVDGTRHVVERAAAAGVPLVYISIVGIDRHRFSYYKAKKEAEDVVAASAAGWTILRATQFHDLLDRFLSFGAFPVTRKMSFQLVESAEVAARLVELTEIGPSGRAEDFGGPEVLPIGEIESARREATGKSTRLIRLPPVGFLRDFDRGLHLTPHHRDGTITWRQWLARRYPPGRDTTETL